MHPLAAPAPLNAFRWPREALDWYQEPRWCVERLLDVEPPGRTQLIVDPFCGAGQVLDCAAARGLSVFGSDLVDRGAAATHPVMLDDGLLTLRSVEGNAVVVSNPPYNMAAEVVNACCAAVVERRIARACLLLRAGFWFSEKRKHVMDAHLARVWLLVPRPSMPPAWLPDAQKGGGSVDFAWFVFAERFGAATGARLLSRNG